MTISLKLSFIVETIDEINEKPLPFLVTRVTVVRAAINELFKAEAQSPHYRLVEHREDERQVIQRSILDGISVHISLSYYIQSIIYLWIYTHKKHRHLMHQECLQFLVYMQFLE